MTGIANILYSVVTIIWLLHAVLTEIHQFRTFGGLRNPKRKGNPDYCTAEMRATAEQAFLQAAAAFLAWMGTKPVTNIIIHLAVAIGLVVISLLWRFSRKFWLAIIERDHLDAWESEFDR